MAERKSAQTLAEFTDQSGREHKVVLMADRLLIDVIDREPPRVLALLRPDEGIEHARAIVFGSDSEDGYVERAKRERLPLCRPLERADLREPSGAERPAGDWPRAA